MEKEFNILANRGISHAAVRYISRSSRCCSNSAWPTLAISS